MSEVDKEIEYMSILLKHPELVEMTVVKKEYFENKTIAKMFEILQEIKTYDPTKFVEKGFEDMDFFLMVQESFMFPNAYKKMFKYDENAIINHHKTKLLDKLNLKLAKREVDFISYKEQFDEIMEIKPIADKEHLTEKEILQIVNAKEKFVFINDFVKLSRVLKLESNDTVTVAAPPGFGKSAFLMNVFNSCINDDKNYCQYYNLEINNKQVIKRLLAIESNEMVKDIYKYGETKKENIGKAIKRLADKEYYLYNNSINWERLQAEIISHLKSDRQNIVFIDYLGLVGLENKNYNKTNYDRVTFIMKEIRKLCKKYNVLIFLASQCDRNSLRNDKLTLYSLKDSGEIENSSTHVCLLYENKQKKADFEFLKNVIVDVAKNRNNYTYRIDMQFISNKQKFKEEHEKDVRE